MTLTDKQLLASDWFRRLRDSICAEFEAIESEYAARHGLEPGRFTFTPWQREAGGSGIMGVMKGHVFEKVGVNISTVHGEFSEQFRAEIPGAANDPRFWASGISLVSHPTNPHTPAAHMNTRMICVGGDVHNPLNDISPLSTATAGARSGGVNGQGPEGAEPPVHASREPQKLWFGGGGDLNPAIAYPEDTADFHAAFRATCDAANPEFYPAFRDWCEEYFFLPHRGVSRGVGGIFYDYLGLSRLGTDRSPVTSGRFGKGGLNAERTQRGMDIANHAPLDWDEAFAFTRRVGETFRDSYSRLVRRRMETPSTEADRHAQLVYRGRYAEYNLLYDRGTRFGLMTGGNTEAILMSLPPLAVWE